ncbi:ROK family protein [Chloroflexota bacterium]
MIYEMKEAESLGQLVLAVDLGGTKIIAALISSKGEMVDRDYSLTVADEGLESVIGKIFSAVDRLCHRSNISQSQLGAISVAAAGVIDMGKGIITKSPNLPGWIDVPLRDRIEGKYKTNTFLINDANAAALGEHRFGTGKGTSNLVLLTLGTGIGGGIIINGDLYFGSSGGAGEVGHMTIDVNGPRCNCGNVGCLEMLASGKAVAREAIRCVSLGEQSCLAEMVGGRIENITAREVSLAAQQGDPLSSGVIARAAECLGAAMVNLVNVFSPEIIVVGGGMSNMGDLLLDSARQIVKERAFKLPSQAVRIVTARLGEDAGVFGAAAFAF